jgi:hypothetical protein
MSEKEIIEEAVSSKVNGAPASVSTTEAFDWDAYENGAINTSVSKEDLEKAYDQTLTLVKE